MDDGERLVMQGLKLLRVGAYLSEGGSSRERCMARKKNIGQSSLGLYGCGAPAPILIIYRALPRNIINAIYLRVRGVDLHYCDVHVDSHIRNIVNFIISPSPAGSPTQPTKAFTFVWTNYCG